MTQDPKKHNQAMIDAERELCELAGRVFGAAAKEDVDALLTEFASFCGAFDRHAIADPAQRDIFQGRRQAFFWLADHLQLSMAECWPRYLKPQER